jgi:hypothetical protein
VGVPGLPIWGGAWRCVPTLDRLVGKPHCQASALARACVTLQLITLRFCLGI